MACEPRPSSSDRLNPHATMVVVLHQCSPRVDGGSKMVLTGLQGTNADRRRHGGIRRLRTRPHGSRLDVEKKGAASADFWRSLIKSGARTPREGSSTRARTWRDRVPPERDPAVLERSDHGPPEGGPRRHATSTAPNPELVGLAGEGLDPQGEPVPVMQFDPVRLIRRTTRQAGSRRCGAEVPRDRSRSGRGRGWSASAGRLLVV